MGVRERDRKGNREKESDRERVRVVVFIVAGKASRTEKFLGACAAGKWVLHKSYMEACRAERKFVEVRDETVLYSCWNHTSYHTPMLCTAIVLIHVQEEDHEWGVNTGGNELQPLEYAPRRWRVALAQQRKV